MSDISNVAAAEEQDKAMSSGHQGIDAKVELIVNVPWSSGMRVALGSAVRSLLKQDNFYGLWRLYAHEGFCLGRVASEAPLHEGRIKVSGEYWFVMPKGATAISLPCKYSNGSQSYKYLFNGHGS